MPVCPGAGPRHSGVVSVPVITGGWAIDLATGHVTRDHADVNVNVMMLKRDEHALRGLTGAGIQLIADGQPPGPWAAGRRPTAGPAPRSQAADHRSRPPRRRPPGIARRGPPAAC
ncbi:MAG: nucleotidyltransferase domain-containing protein [Streptosporangiaceae bacterium]